jgi:hypothetical protein
MQFPYWVLMASILTMTKCVAELDKKSKNVKDGLSLLSRVSLL